MDHCGSGGPGWKSPAEAIRYAEREKLMYVCCIQPDTSKPDYLATVDIDPDSSTYSQVIHRMYLPNTGDELHHMGWNACSSCYSDCTKKRDKIILPCLKSSRIYVADTSDMYAPKIHKVIEGSELAKFGVSTPHTSHCLPNNTVLISTLGDTEDNSLGQLLVIDGHTWEVAGLWTTGYKTANHGYDYWYQPYWDVLVASEFMVPYYWKQGIDVDVLLNMDMTGHSLNIYSWTDRNLIQTIDLGEDGMIPLETRFLHDPKSPQGFVGCAFSSTVFRFYKNYEGTWSAEKVISIPKVKANNWVLPEIPGMITDILLSMDDKWLYISNWLQGDIRQYDITDTKNPRLASYIYLGGLLTQKGLVDPVYAKEPLVINGVTVEGGPQMMQLSIDGKRLYVTNSLISSWDKQLYPEMARKGSAMLQIDVDNEVGGMTLNRNFFIDFGKEPGGPVLAHECRYPGGDCSSDIFLADCYTPIHHRINEYEKRHHH